MDVKVHISNFRQNLKLSSSHSTSRLVSLVGGLIAALAMGAPPALASKRFLVQTQLEPDHA
jgi:hypothetical protein